MPRDAAVPDLLQSLGRDPNPMARRKAAKALGAIGTGPVVARLRRAWVR